MVASYICSSEIAGAPAASLFPAIPNLTGAFEDTHKREVASSISTAAPEIQTVQIAVTLALVIRFTWTPIWQSNQTLTPIWFSN